MMTVPTSIDTQFRRLNKLKRELKATKVGEAQEEDTSILVAEIANTCTLTLDKAMNAVWNKYNSKKPKAKKANVYFPVTNDDAAFDHKLSQCQVPNLKTLNPELYEILYSRQLHRSGKWLGDLQIISKIRHETFPEIGKKSINSTLIGIGQNIYIKELRTGANGEITHLEGTEFSPETGESQPLRIEFSKKVINIVKEVNMTPQNFCNVNISETRKVVVEIYKQLAKRK
jgi:hypothetical protein